MRTRRLISQDRLTPDSPGKKFLFDLVQVGGAVLPGQGFITLVQILRSLESRDRSVRGLWVWRRQMSLKKC